MSIGESKRVFISIVIPVYNEERSIGHVLDEHIARLDGIEQWEIICLDDASTDGTWGILEEYAGRQRHLRLVRHEKNQGISLSFRQLFQEARGDYIYLTAGDGQWPAENLTRLLKARQETQADLVIGVREGRDRVYGVGRKILSYGFNYLAACSLRLDVKDINGIKLGRRDIFTAPVHSKSFFAEVERLAAARQKNYQIVFAPVIFLPRLHGKPKGARLGNIVSTLSDFVRFLK
jgi:glycosyltransferase involved in cell wall biosynthesis